MMLHYCIILVKTNWRIKHGRQIETTLNFAFLTTVSWDMIEIDTLQFGARAKGVGSLSLSSDFVGHGSWI